MTRPRFIRLVIFGYDPPDVVVVTPTNVEEGETDIRLMCRTVGEPNTLCSQSWTQTIDQTLIADQFTYETATREKIVLAKVSLDDTGTYTCSVSNGIADRQGHTLQSNTTTLLFKVAPKFNNSGHNQVFYGELHKPLSVRIPFYSNPPVTYVADIEWTLTTGDMIISSGDITFNLQNEEVIYLSIKGKSVPFSGQAAIMNIRSFDQSLAGGYTVTVYNDGRRKHSTLAFSVTSSTEYPTSPADFRVTDYTSSSITVQWTKGFNGGHAQTFVIRYKPMGGSSIQTVSVLEQQQSTYTKEITGLKPNTRYQLNMYAHNVAGNSSLSSVVDIISKTQQEMTSSSNTACIALFISSSLMLAATASMIVCLIYRRRNKRKMAYKDRKHTAESGSSLSQSPADHDNQIERSHYDELKLEEREPQSSYEYLGSNAAAELNAQASTEDRKMYESLGARNNASVYEELKEPTSRMYENTIIR